MGDWEGWGKYREFMGTPFFRLVWWCGGDGGGIGMAGPQPAAEKETVVGSGSLGLGWAAD